MIIKSDIENEQFLEIENLIKKGKYQDIIQFIKISISNQLQEEKNEGTGKNNSDDISEEISKKEGLEERQQVFQESLKHLKLIKAKNSINFKKEVDFIWNFYNRFFPVKLSIVNLAQLITPEKPYCNLDEWQIAATEMGQTYRKILEEFDEEMDHKRDKKISIALPTHSSILNGIKRKGLRQKTEKKMNSSKNKFSNQFVGRYNVTKEFFEGAPFAMGLISFEKSGNNFLISLTNLGKEFASLQNPILNGDYFNIFSNEEVELIYRKIIPQFKKEKEIIEKIIKKLKNEELTSNELDKSIFSEYKELILKCSSDKPKKSDDEYVNKKIIEARIGTMGRLSELKIVNWKMVNGTSYYSLNEEKMNLLGL
jgi:hypothetical protein